MSCETVNSKRVRKEHQQRQKGTKKGGCGRRGSAITAQWSEIVATVTREENSGLQHPEATQVRRLAHHVAY